MISLGVNIDHVATVRQARRTYEPDPVWASVEAQLGGAEGITVHLREDRRHIQDHDVERIKSCCQVKLNLEMGATDEMVKIACRIKPDLVMLVPEGRQEVTTEGGLDVAGQVTRLKKVVKKLTDHGLVASAFIDTEKKQIEACAAVGFKVCEIHTGPYAHAFHAHSGDVGHEKVGEEIQKVREAGLLIQELGMQFNAGHALNYVNVTHIAGLSGVSELHIGHAIVSRSIFVGIREAVREMKRLMEAGARRPQGLV